MDWDEDESTIGTCEKCEADNVRVKRTEDPFRNEVYSEAVVSDWCRKCYCERLEDV